CPPSHRGGTLSRDDVHAVPVVWLCNTHLTHCVLTGWYGERVCVCRREAGHRSVVSTRDAPNHQSLTRRDQWLRESVAPNISPLSSRATSSTPRGLLLTVVSRSPSSPRRTVRRLAEALMC